MHVFGILCRFTGFMGLLSALTGGRGWRLVSLGQGGVSQVPLR